jgi:hypothetical protein
MIRSVVLLSSIVLLFAAGLLSVHAQQSGFNFPGIQYPKGQDVSPTFDGWQTNPDGTISFWFGYYNRNTQEEIDLPIGPNNTLDLGNGDQGQPTHFYPGRRWWVFKVTVPKDWPLDKRLSWTLINKGRTNVAKGWRQPEWEADDLLISADGASDRFLMVLGRPIADAIREENDKAPVITPIQPQTVTLPAAATLTVTVNDDGIPKLQEGDLSSDGSRRGGVEGVRVRWIFYRGPGNVRFEPEVSPAAYGKPLTSQTKVTFTAPGNYRLRAIASDGALFSTSDVEVKVNPAAK